MLCFYSLPFPITEAILITENQKYIEENISYYIYPEITNENSPPSLHMLLYNCLEFQLAELSSLKKKWGG